MPQVTAVEKRTATETVLTNLLASAQQPLLRPITQPLVMVIMASAPAVRLEVADTAGASVGRALSVHEWIPMGALSARTQCRCCHCGLVRQYDLSRDARVKYSKYEIVLFEGQLEATDVPACTPSGKRMPPAVGARSWDILSWV
jgi:hypothetical protein